MADNVDEAQGAVSMLIGTVQQYLLAFILSYLLFWVVRLLL